MSDRKNTASHDKAAVIADKLRNIRMDAYVTAEDILMKCRSWEELEFFYRWCCL